MSTRETRRRALGLFLVALVLGICTTPQFRAFVSLPHHVRLPQGQVQDFLFRLPFRVTVQTDRADLLTLNGDQLSLEGRQSLLSAPISIAAIQTGRSTVDFRLFGLIPLRRMTVDVVPAIRVLPGGHSIGVLLKSRGVIVVGHAAIRDREGALHQPGRDGGVELGDAILQIGGQEVTSEEQAAQLFEEGGKSGNPVDLMIKRKGKIVQKQVRPVQEQEKGKWRVGLYIRDGAAGVGTLTFYEPISGKYGALGHVIADGETTQPIDVRNGHIVDAVVTAIQKGQKGSPGEKIGSFKNEDDWLGTIEKNSRFGIFGSLNRPLQNPLVSEPIPVAMSSQVMEGPAEILTVVEGQKMERFTVEIQRLMRQPTADGKNMIVKITDKGLLEKTGGIVQGMSGSPILQNGRIVGAVTHVFVNDPSRGYGALIEWMLLESGILEKVGGGGIGPPFTFSVRSWQRVLAGEGLCRDTGSKLNAP